MIKKLYTKYHERMAFNAFVSSRFEVAVKHFQRLRELAPQQKGLSFNLGMALLSLGRSDEALTNFDLEYKRHGNSHPLTAAMAEAYYRTGHRGKALKFFKEAQQAETVEKMQDFYRQRWAICKQRESYEQARQAQTLIQQADVHLHSRAFPEAEELYWKATRLDPTAFQALNNLGALYLSQEKIPQAHHAFEAADHLVDLPRIKSNLSYLRQHPLFQEEPCTTDPIPSAGT